MQWTLRGAHLLLQTRTKVLNNELEECSVTDIRGSELKPLAPRLLDALLETASGLTLVWQAFVNNKFHSEGPYFFAIVCKSEHL